MEKELKIEGMNCNHCVMAVKNIISEQGVENPKVEIGKAVFEADEEKLSVIIKAIEEEGYTVVK